MSSVNVHVSVSILIFKIEWTWSLSFEPPVLLGQRLNLLGAQNRQNCIGAACCRKVLTVIYAAETGDLFVVDCLRFLLDLAQNELLCSSAGP